MRRITRKKLKQDEFVSTVDQIFQVVWPYWRQAAAVLGVVLVAVLLWKAVDTWGGSRVNEASIELDKAMATFEQAVADGGGFDQAEIELNQVADTYGRTDQADVARLHLARIAMQRNDSEQARTLLRDLVDRRKNDALGALASLDLIQLRVASGEGLEVAGELQVMVTGRDKQLPRDTALFELGEVYREEQNESEARTYYQTLVDEFPNSPYTRLARQRLAELG